MSRHGLKMITLQPGGGYGDAACEYLAGLDALGVPVTWQPVGFSSANHAWRERIRAAVHAPVADQLMPLLGREIDYDVVLLDVPPPGSHRDCVEAEAHAHLFAYAAWEVDRLPAGWTSALNLFERVFVPCEVNRDVFVRSGVDVPVDVVPHAARRTEPVVGGAAWGDMGDDAFVFYTIGAWTTRKAIEQTVRAYLEAFDATDNVALILKTHPIDSIAFAAIPDDEREAAPRRLVMVWWTLAHILAEYPNPAMVHLIAGNIPAREIDRLHTRADCYVSLAHSEGWGLGAFDALLFGNPVVMTGWGGQMDYLGADYPLAVRYELESTAHAPPDNNFLQSPDAFWARASRSHASELMRLVFEDRKSARAIGRQLQARLRVRFSPRVICRRLAGLMGFQVAA